MAAPQADHSVGSPHGPEHAGLFETRADSSLASSFDYARTDKQVMSAKPTIVRVFYPGTDTLSGLYVHFCCFEEAPAIAQDTATAEGSYWHVMVHRQEPDAGNAAYWFRRVGAHAIFPALARAAGQEGRWDPFAFIEMCEQARRQPGSELQARARAIQRVEWQLLFDYCARPAG